MRRSHRSWRRNSASRATVAVRSAHISGWARPEARCWRLSPPLPPRRRHRLARGHRRLLSASAASSSLQISGGSRGLLGISDHRTFWITLIDRCGVFCTWASVLSGGRDAADCRPAEFSRPSLPTDRMSSSSEAIRFENVAVENNQSDASCEDCATLSSGEWRVRMNRLRNPGLICPNFSLNASRF